MGDGGVGAVEHPADVDLDHPPPLLQRCADGGAEQHYACVVDQHVEPAELPDRALDRRLRLLRLAHVRLDRHGRAADVADALREVLQAIRSARCDRHGGSSLGEGEGRGLADAAGGSGDERDCAFEFGVRCHEAHYG